MFKIVLFFIMVVTYVEAGGTNLPYTALSEETTQNLECSLAKALEKDNMRGNFNLLEISSRADILRYMENKEDIPLVNFSKALIVDYLYKNELAFDFYKNSKDLIYTNNSVGYDIAYFLARYGDVNAALGILTNLTQIVNEYQIAKMKAFILIANGMPVTSDVLFQCKKRKTFLRDIEREFYNCTKKF